MILTPISPDFGNNISKISTAIQEYNGNLEKSSHAQFQHVIAISQSNSSLGTYLGHLNGAQASLSGYIKYLITTKTETLGATVGTKLLTVSMNALRVATNMVAVTLISIAVEKVIEYFVNLSQAQQKAIDTANELTSTYNEHAKTINSNISSLQGLQTEFTDLSKGVNSNGENIGLTTDQFKRYHEIVKQIVDIQPSLIKGFDSQGNAIVDNTTALGNAINYEKQQLEIEKQKYLVDANKIFTGAQDEAKQHTDEAKKSVQELTHEFGSLTISSKEYTKALAEASLTGKGQSNSQVFDEISIRKISQELKSDGIDYQKLINGNAQELSKLSARQDEIVSKIKQQNNLTDGQASALSNIIGKISTASNAIGTANQKVVSLVDVWASLSQNSSWYNKITKAGVFDDFNKAISKFVQDNPTAEIEDVENAAAQLGKSFANVEPQVDKVKSAVDDLNKRESSGKIRTDDFNKGINQQSTSLSKLANSFAKTNPLLSYFLMLLAQGLKDNLKDASDSTVNFSDTLNTVDGDIQGITSKINDYASSMSTLDTAIDTVNNGNLLTGEQVAALIQKYPSLTDKIINTGYGYKFQKGALDEVRKAQIEEQEQAINTAIADAQNTLNSCLTQVNAYKTLIGTIHNVAEAKAALAGYASADIRISGPKIPDSGPYDPIHKQYAAARDALKQYISEYDNIANDEKKLEALKKSSSLIGKNNYQKVDNQGYSSAAKASEKAQKAAETAAKKQEEAAKKAAQALKDQYEAELKIIDFNNEMGRYGENKINYYNALLGLWNKWKNTKLDSESLLELQEKVYNAHKDYEQDVLDVSYQELDNRISLGQVEENSIDHLNNLLQIQKNLNSANMSLVRTKENVLELDKKIYEVRKAYQEDVLKTSYDELQGRMDLGLVREGSVEELNNLLEIQKNLTTNPNMSIANTEENREELEKKIYDAKKAYEQNVLEESYSELQNREDVGLVEQGSTQELQNLLEIQKNLTTNPNMSLVDTEENRLELNKKIYDAKKGIIDNDISDLDVQVRLGNIQENSLEYLRKLNDLKDEIENSDLNRIDKANELNSIEEKILDARKGYIQQLESDLSDESIEGSYGYQIKQIQDKIDALNNESDAESKELALEKARAAFEEAQQQKSIQIFRQGKGFVYEADTSDINEKQQALADAKRNKEIEDLTKQKQAVQDQLDDEKAQLEHSIKILEGYDTDSSNLWNDIQKQVANVLDDINSNISDHTNRNLSNYNINSRALRNYIKSNSNDYNTEINDLNQFSSDKQTNQNLTLKNDAIYSNKTLTIQNQMISQMRKNLTALAKDCINYGKSIDANLNNGIDTNKSIPTHTMEVMIQGFGSIISQFVNSCTTYGKGIVTQLNTGLNDKTARKQLSDDIDNMIDDIVDQFKKGFGISSPSKVMYQIGKYMMEGLVNGLSSDDLMSFLKDRISESIKDVSDAGTEAMNGGISQWRSVAAEALLLTGHYSKRNLDLLMQQMQTESGGNPNAINLWDSNAKAGHPSQGLMQVIPSTFDSYALPGYDTDILDPLSNIIAAIRYTWSRYGGPEGVWGEGHGYASGTQYSVGGLAQTDEEGYELKLQNLGNGKYTLLNEGSMVLTAADTKNLYNLAHNAQADLLKSGLQNKINIPNITNRNSETNHNDYHINKVEFPNVTDHDEIKQAFTELPTYFLQKSYSNK